MITKISNHFALKANYSSYSHFESVAQDITSDVYRSCATNMACKFSNEPRVQWASGPVSRWDTYPDRNGERKSLFSDVMIIQSVSLFLRSQSQASANRAVVQSVPHKVFVIPEAQYWPQKHVFFKMPLLFNS